jgi:ribonucleoside-triphosphate reductase (thioredoxin)
VRCRYFDFMEEHLRTHQGYTVPQQQRQQLEEAVLALEVMPSMRALMTAGPALKQSGIAGYNCSYLPIDSLEAFHEILYILMHGTGVGFSVERQFTGVPRSFCWGGACAAAGSSPSMWSMG